MKTNEVTFCEEDILIIYSFISKETKGINKLKLQSLVKQVNSKTLNQSFYAYIEVIKKPIFPSYNDEMALMIMNLKRITQQQIPLSFCVRSIKETNKLIRQNESGEYILMKMTLDSYRTICQNKPHRLISKDEIISRLLSMKQELFQKYNVVHIDLFGSYARGEETIYSDVDLWIEVCKKDENQTNIFSYLSEKTELYADGKIVGLNEVPLPCPIDINRDKIRIY